MFRIIIALVWLALALPCQAQMTTLGAGGTKASASWTPAQLSGLYAWYKADAGVFSNTGCSTPATNSGSVGCWADQSGNSRNLTQATGANQPTYQTGNLNSLPVITNSGSLYLDETTFNMGGTHVSVFVVVKATATSGGRTVACWSTGGSDLGSDAFLAPFFNSLTNPTDYNAGALSNGTVVSSSWNEIGSIWDGANNTMYINNSAQTAQASTPTFAATSTLRVFNGAGATNAMGGSIAEIVITTNAVSSTDRANLHTYFSNKWGV